MIRVSILVPFYNEVDLVPTVIQRILAFNFGPDVETEIVAVDDGSTDGSAEVLDEWACRSSGRVKVFRHKTNRGKGATVRTVIQNATGEFGVLLDSDLEYNAEDLPRVLRPLLEGRADAVFGPRLPVARERRVLHSRHSLANRILTTFCNAMTDLSLTDTETGCKAFRLSLVKSIPLRSNRFGIELELTIKLAQRNAAIYEAPISYRGRTYNEGKKIGFREAVRALWIIALYGLRRDIYVDRGARILDSLAHTPRFNSWMADTIRSYVGANVLEIGAGIGNLTQYLSPGRTSYVASDIDDEHLARLRVRFQDLPNIRLRRCDLSGPEDFSRIEEKADTVICLNVLEHISDDSVGLANIAAALSPSGHAIILVPHDQSIYGTLDRVLGHYRRYSEVELRSKMERAGFAVERVLHFNRITRPAWYVNGCVLRREDFGHFQLWVFDRMVWLWRRIDRALPWPSVSLIAIGRKGAG